MGGIGTCCRGELVLPTESVKERRESGEGEEEEGSWVIMNCHSGSGCFVLFCFVRLLLREGERGEGGDAWSSVGHTILRVLYSERHTYAMRRSNEPKVDNQSLYLR